MTTRGGRSAFIGVFDSVRLAAVLVGIAGACVAAATLPQATARDGRWWQSVTPEQRTEFVAGYASYYTWKLRGPIAFSGAAGAFAQRIDARLTTSPQDRTMAIADLLDADAKAAGPGVGWRGSFAGQYWADLGPAGRLGFVQGVLECRRRDPKSNATFSKAEAAYVAQISTFYGVDDPREPDEALMGTGIVDVLLQHGDK